MDVVPLTPGFIPFLGVGGCGRERDGMAHDIAGDTHVSAWTGLCLCQGAVTGVG